MQCPYGLPDFMRPTPNMEPAQTPGGCQRKAMRGSRAGAWIPAACLALAGCTSTVDHKDPVLTTSQRASLPAIALEVSQGKAGNSLGWVPIDSPSDAAGEVFNR